jgi:hypothetical protein
LIADGLAGKLWISIVVTVSGISSKEKIEII